MVGAATSQHDVCWNILRLLWVSISIATAATSMRSPGHERRSLLDDAVVPRRLQKSSNTMNSTTSTNGSTALQHMLLQNYDRYSYPFEHTWGMNNQTGLPVGLTINFHRVFSLDVTASTADVIVWVRQVWHDPRLVWDPVTYNNITTVQFWVSEGTGAAETSQIWTPDLHLWNAAEPLSSSLADAHALVYSDGTVFWARPGHLLAACKFVGLEQFPFDQLSCTFEIGSWAYSGLFLRPELLEEGFTLGGSQTAGQAFAEFTLEAVNSSVYVYPPFIGSPNEDWPVILYDVRFARAWQPYARGFLVLQIMLNLIGFSTFWLPPQAGERMGLSITALLASVASELVVTEKLPAFGEISWVTQFSLWSMLFTAIALFQNIAVIYLHYHTGSSLVPNYSQWWNSLVKVIDRGVQKCKQRMTPQPTTQNGDDPDSTEPQLSRQNRRKNLLVSWKSSEALHLQRPSVRQGIRVMMGRDADDFKNADELVNNLRWQQIADLMDEISRVAFPAAYGIFLAVKFSRTGL